ncbi:hypothetical protein [Hydrogenophaga sp.]|uniref:hypothetical protein n=1 Tax=Hydrogenophaga sp. TaxID=1904254 RepID=UPI00286E8828|nr:hypothetical protein [Hydrogenophaga sp.]
MSNEEAQFESFKVSLGVFMERTNALLDRILCDEENKSHLIPLVPWISEVMATAMEREFVEQVALAYWSRMGMTATSSPARLKLLELDGLSAAIAQSLDGAPKDGPASFAQTHLLGVCSLTVASLLDAIGDMFPLVRGILRSNLDAIDVALS